MALLRVNGVSKSFTVERGFFRAETGRVAALERVSLNLEAGQAIGVVGESGSGKTTLGRVICRLIEPDTGAVLIDERDVRGYARRELAEKVQMVFQDPFASLNPRLTVGTMLAEAAAGRGRVIDETLRLVGLPPDIAPLYPHQFSGGQRQRIALARALIKGPRLIVADEPLSSLDLSIQNQLLQLFIRLKEERRVSFVFISHDLAAASILADYLLVMRNGAVVEEGPAEQVIRRPRDGYTKRLLSAVPMAGERAV